MKRSRDNGITWDDEELVASDLAPSGYYGYDSRNHCGFVTDNGDIYIYYIHGSTTRTMYYRKSTDNGYTWTDKASVFGTGVRSHGMLSPSDAPYVPTKGWLLPWNGDGCGGYFTETGTLSVGAQHTSQESLVIGSETLNYDSINVDYSLSNPVVFQSVLDRVDPKWLNTEVAYEYLGNGVIYAVYRVDEFIYHGTLVQPYIKGLRANWSTDYGYTWTDPLLIPYGHVCEDLDSSDRGTAFGVAPTLKVHKGHLWCFFGARNIYSNTNTRLWLAALPIDKYEDVSAWKIVDSIPQPEQTKPGIHSLYAYTSLLQVEGDEFLGMWGEWTNGSVGEDTDLYQVRIDLSPYFPVAISNAGYIDLSWNFGGTPPFTIERRGI
jgi:hypothetical protein